MNYRTILLATAAVMFAGAANAEDITAPMYLPGAGKVLSNTSLQYERTSLKHNAGAGEDFRASEEITYGVTDNFSVVAEIGNQFDFEGLTQSGIQQRSQLRLCDRRQIQHAARQLAGSGRRFLLHL